MSPRVLIYSLIMVVLWGSHFTVATLTMRDGDAGRLSVHGLIFFKMLMACGCLGLVMLFTGRLRALRRYTWWQLAGLVLAGFFGYYLYYVLLFNAARRAAPLGASAEASILNYLFPMCTLLASAAIIGEKLTRRALISAVISFAGAYLVICKGDLTQAVPEHWRIDLLALFAAVSWGVFSALARRWPHEPLSGMFIFLFTGLVISGVVLPFAPGRHIPTGWEIYGAFHVGFICNTVATLLWLAALRHAGASLVGNIALLTAVVNLLFICLLIPGQSVHWSAAVGLAVILFGVLLARAGRCKVRVVPDADEPPA